MREFLKIFHGLSQRYSPWTVWSDFITMFACALSNSFDKTHYGEREALYLKTISKYTSQEAESFPQLCAETVLALEKNSEQDYLGKIFMELGLGNSRAGQFFTPYDVCVCMANITVTADVVQKIEEHGYITINDCACGAGATLIAGIHAVRKALEDAGSPLNWQNHVLVVAQDIDHTTALMCYIQLSLLGCAAFVKIGNTLTNPITTNDSKENYWYTPMYFMGPWPVRRFLSNSGNNSKEMK